MPTCPVEVRGEDFLGPTGMRPCRPGASLTSGWRKWDRAELDALLADTAEAVAHRKPRANATAHPKGDDPYGWHAIMLKAMDPARLRSVGKGDRRDRRVRCCGRSLPRPRSGRAEQGRQGCGSRPGWRVPTGCWLGIAYLGRRASCPGLVRDVAERPFRNCRHDRRDARRLARAVAGDVERHAARLAMPLAQACRQLGPRNRASPKNAVPSGASKSRSVRSGKRTPREHGASPRR